MQLFNLLETGLPVFGQTFDVSLNWIGKLIRWLCEGVGVVGVGIILFSLVLKLITLPFDIYQRISMRKQNIQMKANQEKMEKLQKQYANDKDKYNQKVMEMYKENGISLFSSCLPMILSMIIFIVAINAFNAYAQYSNIQNYNTLVDAYNAEMKSYSVTLNEDNYNDVVSPVQTQEIKNESGEVVETRYVYTIRDDAADKYVYYKANLSQEENQAFTQMTLEKKVEYLVEGFQNNADDNYYVDVEKAYANAEIKAVVDGYMNPTGEGETPLTKENAVRKYFVSKAQDAVVVTYDEKVTENAGFGWIKNIWVTDASYKHPVLSESEFVTEAKREKFEVDGKKVKYSSISSHTNAYDVYNEVTAKLNVQKKQANGYFILILLSIGTILLQQVVMNRSQKEQQKYSSVDGSAGSQQKMTMIIMTVMFAFFSFMYSSAFSIYMITSNLFSMFSTLVINKLVDRSVEKKEAAAEVKKYENHAAARIEQAKNAGRQSAQESKNKNK